MSFEETNFGGEYKNFGSFLLFLKLAKDDSKDFY